MVDRIAHPIRTAWVSGGGTGAQNYDEFADNGEIEKILRAQPASILAVDMPHCTPEARAEGRSFQDSLPAARARLQELKDEGRFREVDDVVVGYRISGATGTAYGVMCMVDTDQISTAADEPGRVIRNEDVFPEKVRERTALTETLGHLVSSVLLLQTRSGPQIEQLLEGLFRRLGRPDVSDTDQLDQRHEMWLLPEGPERERLLDLVSGVSGGELIVADGNHRSLSAQQAGLPRFLAVITTPESVHIRPYNRLVRDTGLGPAQLIQRLEAAGCTVDLWESDVLVPSRAGTVELYVGVGQRYSVTLPVPEAGTSVTDRLDHTIVERVIFGQVLGMEPGDERITYVGGDYPVEWLEAEVDQGRAELALLIAPVGVDDFVAVNLARLKMPRKSTWFTPKARTGLVLAEL